MTNETVNNVENETYVEFTEVESNYEPEYCQDSSGGGLAKFVIGGVAIGAAALGAVAFKCKDKIAAKKEKRTIEKLEKKGFIVTKTEGDVIDVEAVEVEEDEVETK